MADLRELIILNPGIALKGPESPLQARIADGRMAVRRAVVASSRSRIMHRLHRAIYDAHFSVVAAVAKRFTGTRAVYGGGGVTAGDLYVGISDVDIAIFGDWSEKSQFNLLKTFGVLTVLSPLYDRGCMVNICTVNDLKQMQRTDMLLAMMYERGRSNWRLLLGEDVLRALPPIAPERFAGCVAMDLRRWWNSMTSVTFGNTVMSRDSIFRNSVCFKVVAEMLRAEHMREAGVDSSPRRIFLERAIANGSADTALFHALLQSVKRGFLDRAVDLREQTFRWLAQHMEAFQASLAHEAGFTGSLPAQVDGTADERYILPATLEHCERVVQAAQREWPTLQAAYLVPTLTMMSPDSLALILRPGSSMPTVEMLRVVSTEHLKGRDRLPQRLRLYLMLQHGIYMLDVGEGLDLFHLSFTKSSTPDVYGALSAPGVALVGEALPMPGELGWSPFAAEVAAEELHARKGAFVRFGLMSRPGLVDNLRNFWRYLQLMVVEHTSVTSKVILPITVPAIQRAIGAWLPELQGDLEDLQQLFYDALFSGNSSSIQAELLMQRVYQRVADV